MVTLEGDMACRYFGMTQNEVPRCIEKKLMKNIQEDGGRNLCQINQKRHDGRWVNETHVVTMDTPTEWKKGIKFTLYTFQL